jgi:hypothetical protein
MRRRPSLRSRTFRERLADTGKGLPSSRSAAGDAGANGALLPGERKCTMKIFSKIVVGLVLASGSVGATAGEAAQLAGEAVRMGSGQVVFSVSLPVVLPTLVVVQPGVSVVPNQDVEVFYSGGYYWTRHDSYWYRSHDHKGGWARIDEGHVPTAIAHSPPGQYRHYDGKGHGNGNDKGNGKGKSGEAHGKSDKHGGDHD